MNDYNDESSNELYISDEIRGFLYQTAKWSNFLSIVGFIAVGVLIVISILSGSFNLFGSMVGGMSSAFMSILYLLSSLLYLFPVLFLYRFSKGIKSALTHNDQYALNEAFNYLKKHYSFIGILTVAVFCLYLLMFVLMILFI